MKTTRRRYTDAERTAILADMRKHGLTQVAAAKKYGVSAVTIWQWRRAGNTSNHRARAVRPVASNSSLVELIRAEILERVRVILPGIVAEEVARALGKTPR